MNKTIREEIFARLAEAFPEPTTELNYSSPFELLTAVLLSAQATDIGVNKATATLFPLANTPQQILALGEAGVESHIKSIGLFNSKAKHLLQTAKILHEQYNDEVPDQREALESLPGVGRKTANVVLNTAFGQPTIAVDTHIFRVSNRTRIAPGKDVLEVEMRLLRRVPKRYLQDAHHLLILHGRYTCVARKPRCEACSIVALCEYREKRLG